MMNGNVEAHLEHKEKGITTNKAWLEELKMSQTKKQISQGDNEIFIQILSLKKYFYQVYIVY